MKRWRLRTKLTLWSALVTGLALLTLGLVAAINVFLEEIKEIDHRLAANSNLLFAEMPGGSGIDWSNADRSAAVLKNAKSLHGFAIGGTAGTKVAAVHVYPAELAPLFAAWPPAKPFSFARLGHRWLRLAVFTRENRTLVIAADAGPARETVEELLIAYFLALPIVLVVVGIGSWWIAGRALRPIAEITAAAAAITAERLDARLPVPPADDEIGRHTRVLNAMFDRLQRSFEQANRFTADASHELRTPLTILRGEIEEALRSSAGRPEQEKVLVSLLEQTGALQKISANLLLLARFDAGKSQLEKAPLDFSASVIDAVEDAGLLAAPARVKVSAVVAPEVRVNGDAVLLRRVLLNLVDNAVRYNQPDGEVRFNLRTEEGDAVFSIANTGRGIPTAKHGELFQRFFRLDSDRNRASGGSGLGLSLCREIIHAHGGTITLGRSDETWTEFLVHLPRLAVLSSAKTQTLPGLGQNQSHAFLP
jgi:two-component system, OmpR family, heavy metal sensor histidine kinase CusS